MKWRYFMKYLGLTWSAVTAVIIYTGLIFGGQAWMLSAKIKPIEIALNNHLSETNRKIDNLKIEITEVRKDLKSDITEVRQDIKEIRQDIKELLKRK